MGKLQAVILAAGRGERLEPLTLTKSKVMIPVANKPFIQWVYDSVNFAEEVLIVIRKEQKDVKEYFSKNKKIRFVYQKKALGTADAIKQCEKYIKDKFMVINGDCLISEKDIKKLSKSKKITVSGFAVEDIHNYGEVVGKKRKLIELREKPINSKGNLANAGLYLFDKSIFSAIRKTKISKRKEYEITDSINILVRERKIDILKLSDWKTITYPWDLLEINKFILDNTGSQISKKAEIRSGAVIEHPVAIGDNAIIGPNCYIRKYSSIGNNCKVGSAVEIKNSIIMDNSFVSHLSYVGDSIVGSNCNIAAGTIFANLRLDDKTVKMKIKNEKTDSRRRKLGGIVGDNVKFGVNVTIMPGKKIWPNLLIPPGIMIKEDVEKQPVMQ